MLSLSPFLPLSCVSVPTAPRTGLSDWLSIHLLLGPRYREPILGVPISHCFSGLLLSLLFPSFPFACGDWPRIFALCRAANQTDLDLVELQPKINRRYRIAYYRRLKLALAQYPCHKTSNNRSRLPLTIPSITQPQAESRAEEIPSSHTLGRGFQ